mmetsp:Transcript_34696/g.95648  ORF Transcript_34696/g.95648 Transcript_34696/m.95648 type:complete len:468 (-) Transcript_34696:391-1794(-)
MPPLNDAAPKALWVDAILASPTAPGAVPRTPEGAEAAGSVSRTPWPPPQALAKAPGDDAHVYARPLDSEAARATVGRWGAEPLGVQGRSRGGGTSATQCGKHGIPATTPCAGAAGHLDELDELVPMPCRDCCICVGLGKPFRVALDGRVCSPRRWSSHPGATWAVRDSATAQRHASKHANAGNPLASAGKAKLHCARRRHVRARKDELACWPDFLACSAILACCTRRSSASQKDRQRPRSTAFTASKYPNKHARACLWNVTKRATDASREACNSLARLFWHTDVNQPKRQARSCQRPPLANERRSDHSAASSARCAAFAAADSASAWPNAPPQRAASLRCAHAAKLRTRRLRAVDSSSRRSIRCADHLARSPRVSEVAWALANASSARLWSPSPAQAAMQRWAILKKPFEPSCWARRFTALEYPQRRLQSKVQQRRRAAREDAPMILEAAASESPRRFRSLAAILTT